MAQICTRAERQARKRLRECASSIPLLETAAEWRNPDTIHDVRVGCRRTRVTLAEFGDQFAPGPRREARERFREIRKRLGRLRELDVCLALLDTFAVAYPEAVAFARARLGELRHDAETAVQDLGPALNGANPSVLIAELQEAYRRTTECYRKHAESRLKKRLKNLSRQYTTWTQTQRPDDLHDLRIRFKKMRYTLEVYVDLYGKPGKDLLRSLESAQDTLGDWNDHRVLKEYIARMLPEADAATELDLRALSEAIAARIEAFLAAFTEEASRFFKKDEIRSAKNLFAEPKLPCCDKT